MKRVSPGRRILRWLLFLLGFGFLIGRRDRLQESHGIEDEQACAQRWTLFRRKLDEAFDVLRDRKVVPAPPQGSAANPPARDASDPLDD
ncbi:MAG: hypothetical protein IMW91_09460 [Firmicutes bacterium]|nr:hypothetical protein [Bacillota bacterium]